MESSRTDIGPAEFRDVHGIINLQEISKLFTKMLTRLDEQDRMITSLQYSLTTFVDINSFQSKLSGVENAIASIEGKLSKLAIACTSQITVNGLEQEFSAGELAACNHHELQRIKKVLSGCVGRPEVEAQYQKMMHIDEKNKVLQRDVDRICKVTDELNSAHVLINSRVSNMDAALANKLDRSELAHLQSLAARVALYDEFRRDTLDSLQRLHQHDVTADGRLDEHDRLLANTSNELQAVSKEVNKLFSTKAFHEVKKEIARHGELLSQCSSKATAEEMKRQMMQMLKILEENQLQLRNDDQRIGSLDRTMLVKADKEEVRACLLKEQFQKFAEQNNTVLRSKAALTITDALQHRAQHLEDNLALESKRIDVAVRFAEWFTSRGEHHEHNLQILDKHLKDLLVADKSPRVHSYYIPGNRVGMENYGYTEPKTATYLDMNA